MATPMSAHDLAARYPDPNFRDAIRNLLNVRALLAECIIGPGYRVPQELHQGVVLSESGDKVFEALTRRQSVPYPEARMMCFLEMWHIDLLVDPIATKVDEIVSAMTKQIRNGEILFPFTHGRLLYDKAADLTLNAEKVNLSNSETIDLLSGTPQGVFQSGQYVTGPYGVLLSNASRFIDPMLRVLFHCSDLWCDEPHSCSLASSPEATINEHREKIKKQLARESKEPSDWIKFLRDTNTSAPSYAYDDAAGDAWVFLIGDALNLKEQRLLLSWLLDNAGATVREPARALGLVGAADQIVAPLNQAEVLQLILVAPNKSVENGLDHLALTGQIEVPEGEVRSAVLNGYGSGPYGLFGELNRYGARLRSSEMVIAPLRLRRLIGQMYPLGKQSERQELDFQMRGEPAETTEERIEKYLEERSPREVISSLLLVRLANLIVATEKLNIVDNLLLNDEDRINSVLWKLGFSITDNFDPHGPFWRYHEKLRSACQQAGVNPQLVDIEQIRERSGTYFPALEALLKDTLLYATWALTNDHWTSDRRFTYRPQTDADIAQKLLDEYTQARPGERVRLKEPLTLYGLSHGFRVLGDYLDSLIGRADEMERDPLDIPVWAKAQELQIFPFMHTVPFLDLLPESQTGIIDGLRSASRKLAGAEVSEVRNSLAHPRTADLARLRIALEVIEETVTFFRNAGYLRQFYRRIRSESDEAGRRTMVFADPYDQTAIVHSPSYFDWTQMPLMIGGVHFMASAYFYEPSKVLRFRTQQSSPFSELWSAYPRRQLRRESRSVAGHKEPRTHSSTIVRA